MNKFTNPAIELVKSLKAHEAAQKKRYKWPYYFGSDAVDLAIGVIHDFIPECELLGIKKCLKHQIKRFKHTNSLLGLVKATDPIGYQLQNYGYLDLLADSLILNVLEYQKDIAQARYSIECGFELVCMWGTDSLLDIDSNEFLVMKDYTHLSKYILQDC